MRRLEAPQLDVTVVGRVSSGKSSLLNHLAGLDVLPVGVTPVTAVPTRLVRGDRPAALITFAEAAPRAVPVEELREYASEEGNPGNRNHVTSIVVQVPSARLPEGVVFVDTPGVGSLAHSGSAETFAYLPRCDLGVVLIGAASTLVSDDIELLRLLYEAGIPAQVVLSKADLLTPADRKRSADYVREQLRRELGVDLAVHPVSTVGANDTLLTAWFQEEVEPLLDRRRALTAESLRRKAGRLREAVTEALRALLAQRRAAGPPARPFAEGQTVRRLLEETDAALLQAQARCRDWAADVPALVEIILDDAAQAVVSPAVAPVVGEGAARRVLAERDRMARGLAAGLQAALSRALAGVRQVLPLAAVETEAIRDVALVGLPAPDLGPLEGQLQARRPWWTSLFPGLARAAVRSAIGRRTRAALCEQVGLHDRQLQAWLRSCLGRLAEQYEAQAEVFREQTRPVTGAVGTPTGVADLRDLEQDVQALQQTGVPEPEGAAPG